MTTLPPSRLDAPTGAVFSDCGRYRYLLWRNWRNGRGKVLFVGLNPSTADASRDDPTIRRCIGFARAWGHGGVMVANLFAWRATRPVDLLRASRPEGADNDEWLDFAVRAADRILVCWGNPGAHRGMDRQFLARHAGLQCLSVNRTGAPAHPLYQPASTVPQDYPVRSPD